MECRNLEITLVSAQNLPDVRNLGLMKVYAKVSLKGESKTTRKSPADYQGESNPTWNFLVDYTVSESTVRKPGVNLLVKLMCKRTLGDRLVGEVRIPVKDLFDMGMKSQKILSYDVAGTAGGSLNLLYSFSEIMLVRRPSHGWKTALETMGFLVVLGGAMLLLGGDNSDNDGDDDDGGDHHGDPEPAEGSRDDYVEVHDGNVFYDAN